MKIEKSDWILVILRKKPLDRVHIMKILFLIWHRSKGKLQDYFYFEPYFYGPYSLEVYAELRNLLAHGLVVQPPHPIQKWANYYLTNQGHIRAAEAAKKFSPKVIDLIDNVLKEISHLSFFELLQKVYREAPNFAANSVFKELLSS